MALDKNAAVTLANQIQSAHRFAVGFYQRLLPTITQSAESFGFRFYYWDSVLFNRPASYKVNPDRKWAWDLVPMNSPYFMFIKQEKKGELTINDQMLTVYFCSDPGLYEDTFDEEPDPLELDESTPTIELVLTRAHKSDSSICFTEAYENDAGEVEEEGKVVKFTEFLEGSIHTLDLSDFLVAPEAEIKSFIDFHEANNG